MAYSIEIDGTPVKYKTINFTKRHPSEDCDEFSTIVEWGAAVSQFSAVIIKKSTTALFYGLVETINPMWDEGVRYKQLNGRCYKVYVWKKFTERFERGHIDGFFGAINPSKLAEFILRCPISEDPSSSVFHRIGYGVDLNSGVCSAIRTDRKTHAEWCRFRHLGFRWLLGWYYEIGSRVVDGYTQDTPTIDGCERQREWIHSDDVLGNETNTDLLVDGRSNPWETDDWTQVGANDPWLDVCDDDSHYIHVSSAAISGGIQTQSYFTFADIGATYHAFDADRTNCSVYVKARLYDGGDGFPDSVTLRLYIWCWWLNNCAGEWVSVGTVSVTSHTYADHSLSISGLFTNWGDYYVINHARLKIVAESVNCTSCGTCTDCGGVRVTCAWLRVNGVTIQWQNTNTPWLDDDEAVHYIEGRRNYRYDHYWDFDDIDTPSYGWRDHTINTAELKLKGLNNIIAGVGVDSTVRVYVELSAGGGYTNVGEVTWAKAETSYVVKTINLLTTFPSITITQLNYLRMRLELRTSHDGADTSYCRITYTYLNLNIAESNYQKEDDWFKIDLGSDKTRVMGVLIESRYTGNLFARNYAIETATAAAPTVWTERATKSGNDIRDILESWSPIVTGVRYVRIRITDDVNYGWEISQVFVWQGEDPDYDINGDGTDLTIGAVGSANFADYGNMIDPISFGFQRINEALSHICETAHASYVPWEWWVIHNATHDFVFKEKRGTDRSGTVIFERGKHIKSVDVSYTNRGTVQRARFVGRGEGKDQDEIASDWKVDAGGIAEVNTFYEAIISDKSVGDKTQADTLAKVYTTQHGKKRVELIVVLNYDPWEGTYEVGDEIKIIDASLSIDDKFRLTVIERTITNEPTNETTLTLTNSWYDVADLWAEIKRELRNAGLTGTVLADWRGEGGNQNALSAEKMDDVWNAQAQNEEIEPPAEKDDDRWNVPNDGVNSQEYRCDEDFFCIKGSKLADETAYFIKATLMKDETFEDGWIDFDQSPRFVCEVKIPYEGSDPAAATDWRVGDFCRIWMHNDSNKGFGFTIKRASGGLEVWSYFLDAGGAEHEVLLADTVNLNDKFRLEARVDWNEKLVKWYYNNVMKAVFAFDSSETGSGTNMFPVFVYHCTSNPVGGVSYWAWLFIYDFRAQAVWEA